MIRFVHQANSNFRGCVEKRCSGTLSIEHGQVPSRKDGYVTTDTAGLGSGN